MKRTPIRQKSKLWKVFSLYIRQRDNYQCFTCGRHATGSGMHAGHYIPKSAGGIALYFHEQNVHAQCYNCNINLSGNSDIYSQKIIEKYGQETLDHLRQLRNETHK